MFESLFVFLMELCRKQMSVSKSLKVRPKFQPKIATLKNRLFLKISLVKFDFEIFD